MSEDPKKEESFRRVRTFYSSFNELGKALADFHELEYVAWYDEKLKCWVCELHIPKNQEGRS